MDRPKVFEEGTVTLVAGPRGLSLYVGSHELQMFSEVELRFGDGKPVPTLKLRFQRSHDEEVRLKLDEERRTASSLPWADVSR